jgi:hypothetical protein
MFLYDIHISLLTKKINFRSKILELKRIEYENKLSYNNNIIKTSSSENENENENVKQEQDSVSQSQ